MASWCSIDTSSGNLTVVLEPNNCFDAEMYADELELEEPVEFREDQRSTYHLCPVEAALTLLAVNLGKWVLRYLFANLIDEEIRRDEAHRHTLEHAAQKRTGRGTPMVISIPPPAGWSGSPSPSSTPRANGSYPPITPGFAIGVATPGSPLHHQTLEGHTPLSPLDRKMSRPSVEREDYFSDAINAPDPNPGTGPVPTPASAPPIPEAAKTLVDTGKEKEKEKEKEKDKDKEKDNGKGTGALFGKRIRGIGKSFPKIGRSASTAAVPKPAVETEKAEESESSSNHEKEFEDSFYGVIQRIRDGYEKQHTENPETPLETGIAPSLPNDTPVLKLPPGTKVILQEETSGGSAELYRGTVESVGLDADLIEKRGAQWLGEVLLTNTIPPKEPVKVSFVLFPWHDELPAIATADGNNRLNANRMLRVKKILAYVAERIDPVAEGETPDPDALRPEEYLELYCNEVVSIFRGVGARVMLTDLIAAAYNDEPGNTPRPRVEGRKRHCAALQVERPKGDSDPTP